MGAVTNASGNLGIKVFPDANSSFFTSTGAFNPVTGANGAAWSY